MLSIKDIHWSKDVIEQPATVNHLIHEGWDRAEKIMECFEYLTKCSGKDRIKVAAGPERSFEAVGNDWIGNITYQRLPGDLGIFIQLFRRPEVPFEVARLDRKGDLYAVPGHAPGHKNQHMIWQLIVEAWGYELRGNRLINE